MRIAGIKEVADILGWDRQSTSVYYQRGLKSGRRRRNPPLPEPIQVLSATPVWLEADILKWAKEELGMTIWMVEKSIDLQNEGSFDVDQIMCEAIDGMVAAARYHGVWTPIDGNTRNAVIHAQFIEPVEENVDAVLNAGWETWAVEES